MFYSVRRSVLLTPYLPRPAREGLKRQTGVIAFGKGGAKSAQKVIS